jgi:hypothetical protein
VRRRDMRKVLRMRDEQGDDLCDSGLKLLLCCGSAMRMVSATAKIHRETPHIFLAEENVASGFHNWHMQALESRARSIWTRGRLS